MINEYITRPILVLIALFIIGNFIAAFVAATRLFRIRDVLARHLSMLLMAIAFQGVCWIIAGTYLPKPRPTAFRVWMTIGYAVPSFAVWRLVIYIVRVRNQLGQQ